MRIAIVGSREFLPEEALWVRATLRKLLQGVANKDPATIIVSGGARGVDSWAAAAAREFGLQVEEILPDWNKHGKAAGLLRNTEIVARADRLVAFWDGRSTGTADSIRKATSLGKTVRVLQPPRCL